MNEYEAFVFIGSFFESRVFVGISFMILGISLFLLSFYSMKKRDPQNKKLQEKK